MTKNPRPPSCGGGVAHDLEQNFLGKVPQANVVTRSGVSHDGADLHLEAK
jgi:hypothetical protein